jgi:hypothetical protein
MAKHLPHFVAFTCAISLTLPVQAAQEDKAPKSPQKTIAGRYTITLESVIPAESHPISTFSQFPGGGAFTSDDTNGWFAANGAGQLVITRPASAKNSVQSGYAFQFAVTAGKKDELHFIEGVESAIAATDNTGKRLWSKAGQLMPNLVADMRDPWSTRHSSAFLGVGAAAKSLQTLEGNLIVSEGRVDKIVFEPGKLGWEKPQHTGEHIVTLRGVMYTSGSVTYILSISSPGRRKTTLAGLPDTWDSLAKFPPRIFATQYADGREFKPVSILGTGGYQSGAFNPNMVYNGPQGVTKVVNVANPMDANPDEPDALIFTQVFTFMSPPRDEKPTGFAIDLVTRTKTVRVPFRFTDVKLPSGQ